jgi:hypothetical protein
LAIFAGICKTIGDICNIFLNSWRKLLRNSEYWIKNLIRT